MKNVFLALALLLGSASAQTVTSLFSDVAATHTNADAIVYVQSTGMVNGYPDGTFRADQTINRAEFTKIFINSVIPASQIESCDLSLLPFPDVPADAWFAPYVCVAYSNGTIAGYPDGTFRPAETINFVESAKILTASKVGQSTSDPWFKDYVIGLEIQGAIPTEIETFDANLTRGQMAEMIMRINAEIDNKPSKTFAGLSGETQQDAQEEEMEVELELSTEAEAELDTVDSVFDLFDFEAEQMESDLDSFEMEMVEIEGELDAIIVPEETEAEETTEDAENTENTEENSEESTDASEETNTSTEETSEEAAETEEIASIPAIYIDYTQEAFASAQESGQAHALFFHASWCPSCVALNTEIEAQMAQLPENTIILKADYDAEENLKTEYGVTTQHTGVFFNATGEQTALVTGFSLEDIITNLSAETPTE